MRAVTSAVAKPEKISDETECERLPRAVRHLIYCFVAQMPRTDVRVPALVETLGAVAVRDMRKKMAAYKPRLTHMCLFPSEWSVRTILLNAFQNLPLNWDMISDFLALQHDITFKGKKMGRAPLIAHPQVCSVLLNTPGAPPGLALRALRARRERVGVPGWNWLFNAEYWPLAQSVSPDFAPPKMAKVPPERLKCTNWPLEAIALLRDLLSTQDMGGANFHTVARLAKMGLGKEIMIGSAGSLWPDNVEKMLDFGEHVTSNVHKLGYLQYVPLGAVLMIFPGLSRPDQFPFGSAQAYIGNSAAARKIVDLFPLLYFVDKRLYPRSPVMRERRSEEINFIDNFLRLGYVPSSEFVRWMHNDRRETAMLDQLYAAGCECARSTPLNQAASDTHSNTTKLIGHLARTYTPQKFE